MTLLAVDSVTPVEGTERLMHQFQLLKQHKPDLGVLSCAAQVRIQGS
jgi:hypothetical protein